MFMKNSWRKALAAFAGASILMSVSLSYVEAAAMTNSNQRVAKKIVQTAGRERLGDFAPDFARYNDDILFGEVWSKNDVLSLHDRSIVTVSGLVGSGVIDSSLKYHIQSAKNNGVTKAEMAEIITQLGFYTGWPKAWAAFNMANPAGDYVPYWRTEHGVCKVFYRTKLSGSGFHAAGCHV